MEVKPGYKLTEVGVIPADWEVAELGKHAIFRTGPFGSALHQSDYISNGIPVINPMHIDNGTIEPSETMTVSEQTANALSDFKLKSGEIVIGRRGDMGRCAVIREGQAGWLCGTGSMIVRPADANADYLQRILSSRRVITAIENASVGTTMVNLNQGTLSSLKIEFPPLPEQSAIATALSDMDALLGGLDRLIAKKRAIKQAAMQQLLTAQTRLPGFSGEWEVRRLDELAAIRSGGTPSTGIDRFWDGEIPWCTPTDITQLNGNKYLTRTNRTITQEGLANSSAELVPANSVVMTSRATIGECAINTAPVTTNQGFKNFIPFDTTDTEFLYYLLQTQKQGFIRLCGGSTFLEIGKTQLAAYEVQLPSTKEEQTAIATVLSDMDAEITALETRRNKTRALKQAMMQELLTGRTRLVELKTETKQEATTPTSSRQANVYFLRSVLAAEIIDQLHDQPTFGHVKFEKMMFLVEHLCGIDTNSHYFRQAAGPYDNRALRSIDSQLRKQQWFGVRKEGERYRYLPMAKQGGHKPYFERYFSKNSETLDKIVGTFKEAKTQQCEIVATLLAAWSDLLREKETVSDEMIVHEVLNNWHESKRQIPEDRWQTALDWMRDKGFVPKGGT